jgi:hypothetical protein
MKYTITKSPSGLYWSLTIAGRFVRNFDTKRAATEYAHDAIRGVL